MRNCEFVVAVFQMVGTSAVMKTMTVMDHGLMYITRQMRKRYAMVVRDVVV